MPARGIVADPLASSGGWADVAVYAALSGTWRTDANVTIRAFWNGNPAHSNACLMGPPFARATSLYRPGDTRTCYRISNCSLLLFLPLRIHNDSSSKTEGPDWPPSSFRWRSGCRARGLRQLGDDAIWPMRLL